MNARPAPDEFAPFYAGYVALVPETDILAVLRQQQADIAQCAGAIPARHEDFRYAPGKWSIREVFGHLIDAERVFAFRAFSFSRGEAAPLPPFDENAYVERSRYHERPLADLAAELRALREAHLAFLAWLDDGAWSRVGTASGRPVSVRALAFIMAGHIRHHVNILRERYGVGAAA